MQRRAASLGARCVCSALRVRWWPRHLGREWRLRRGARLPLRCPSDSELGQRQGAGAEEVWHWREPWPRLLSLVDCLWR